MQIKNKRGQILVENIIFIILNILFLSILVVFLIKQGSGAIILERAYSKEVALLTDSARPGMILHLNLEKLKEVSDKNGVPFSDILKIKNNYVTVKLSEKGGSRYHFFNNIGVSYFPEKSKKGDLNGFYILTFNKKK